MKTITIAALMLTAVASSLPAFAADEHNVAPGLTAAGAPLGLHGVDPVAFIDIGNRLEGRAEYAAVYDGVAYYFASEANKNKFEKMANKYAPQNGGFCTFGVAVGKKFDGDPQYADVVDGKLYVFLNEEVFNAYQKDKNDTIYKAKKQWKNIQHKAASTL